VIDQPQPAEPQIRVVGKVPTCLALPVTPVAGEIYGIEDSQEYAIYDQHGWQFGP
jgi:hypothetical protein